MASVMRATLVMVAVSWTRMAVPPVGSPPIQDGRWLTPDQGMTALARATSPAPTA